MRIKSITIPEKIAKTYGLGRIEMKGLEKIVIIAGKNGAGKTRLLKLVQNNEILIQNEHTSEKERILSNLNSTRKAMAQIQSTLNDYDEKVRRGFALSDSELRDYRFNTQKVEQFRNDIEIAERNLKVEALEFEENLPKSEIFEFIPKRIDLKDSNDLTKKEIKELLTAKKVYKVDDLANITYGTIQALQDIVVTVSDEDTFSQEEKNNRAQLLKKFKRVQEMVRMFLESELGRNLFGETLIFQKTFNEAQLSEGQKVLLQLCVGLIENEVSLEDAILVLDEPENHLHPKILIEVLEKLLSANSRGQIWIATHSIPLIAHFDPSYLWLMDENTVHFAGREPEKIIDSLVGDSEKVRLTEFLNLPAVLAATKFTAECLSPPPTVNTGRNDPQTNQISRIVASRIQKKTIRILDFGAGRGRLIKHFSHFQEEEFPFVKKLDYYAYDVKEVPSEISKECKKAISSFYRKGKNDKQRYFNSKDDINKLGTGFFDIVILCNVLHEIDPEYWQDIFSRQQIIYNSLRDDGFLLIVEDQQMPYGEKAYENGFMVYNKNQFRKLFKVRQDEKYVIDDARNDGRLLAHLIPKEFISRINERSIIDSIQNLREEALRKIEENRKLECNFKNGMRLGFWLHQFANACLNSEKLDLRKRNRASMNLNDR